MADLLDYQSPATWKKRPWHLGAGYLVGIAVFGFACFAGTAFTLRLVQEVGPIALFAILIVFATGFALWMNVYYFVHWLKPNNGPPPSGDTPSPIRPFTPSSPQTSPTA